ncbi:SIMPL domain-containing protein, partial [Arachidicoccus sp.]|uniref:SIMPL domain-containing protein n=1 Tax=Arachidicoccus sp. TaxID=1872624 RepID=UPI003D1E5D38
MAQTNINTEPFIEVNASADTMVVPDEIYISITVSENDNKKLSVEDQEKRMINAFQALNINVEKDLSTSDMISDFKNRFLRTKDVIKTKEYQLKVGDAMTAGKVFAALEDIGIANSSISKVDYSDMESLKNLCRTKAIQNAKVTAETLVKPLGQKVGKAIQIIDANNTPIYNPQVRMYSMAKVAGADETPKIDFEKIKVQGNENVKFILE